jgi:toluene monooxygenase system protein E
MSRSIPPLKTYSHLARQRRVPTEYEVVSTGLLYHPKRGFEVDVPVRSWYERYQRDGALVVADWERFQDPRGTTYPLYTTLQARQEAHLEQVLRSWETGEHDPGQIASGAETFLRAVAPLRFALHGCQMIAAYIGQMAPTGRIAMAALFQAGDEMRRVHRIAYHMAWVRRSDPRVGDDGRAAWQNGAAWQPLRRAVELGLVAWDWGEALVALNVCLKPMIEALFLTELARLARERGDFPAAEVLSSFEEDGRWHQAWSAALLRLAFAERPANMTVASGWVETWYPLARAAVAGAAPLLGETAEAVLARAETRGRAWLLALGLGAP